MRLKNIKATFYQDNNSYNNGECFLEKTFISNYELLNFVDELKKQYPNLIYTCETIRI